jgi:hypothetical protein
MNIGGSNGMFRKLTLAIAAAALGMPLAASAQDWTPIGPMQGSVTGNANGSWTDFGPIDVTQLNFQMTYFVTNVVEVGGGVSFIDSDNDDMTSWFILGNYYLPFGTDPRMKTYVGARFFDFDNGSDGFAGAVGLHYFLRENVSITPELQIGEIDSESYSQLSFGLTIWFR